MRARRRRGATIEDVILHPGGDAVESFVVSPAGDVQAGVLWLHWLGEHHNDRTQFLEEAVGLAGLGVRSVLPAGRYPWTVTPSALEADRDAIETEVRRGGLALDTLESLLPAGAPVALVGHDFGAMSGTILAARTQRFRAAVLIAAVPRWADWMLPFWPIAGDPFDYRRGLAALDPIASVPQIEAPILWQFSRRDFYIAPFMARELARAAPGGNPTIDWTNADHGMRSVRIRASRRAFLVRELGLG